MSIQDLNMILKYERIEQISTSGMDDYFKNDQWKEWKFPQVCQICTYKGKNIYLIPGKMMEE